LTTTRRGGVVCAVGFVSAAVLCHEVSLMRVLLVGGWHHFAFGLISAALLGFGASGTLLVLGRAWALRHAEGLLFALLLATAVAMPLSFGLAQHVPVESRVVPALLVRQVGAWLLAWGLLTLPFLLGAAAIGLGLMMTPGRAGVVYGASLLGSAAGAVLAPVLMTSLDPAWLPAAAGLAALVGSLTLVGASGALRRVVAVSACVAGIGVYLWLDPPRIRLDPYKYGAAIERLVAQGDVQRVGRLHGPRAVVEAYSGAVLHDLPFLAVGGAAQPPRIGVVLTDGHLAGSVLDIAGAADAAVMDSTLMAFAYDLLEPGPDGPVVALLGETGGTNVWLAVRHGAAAIDVVQPDANVIRMLRGPLHAMGGAVLDLPPVRVTVADARFFIERSAARYDLIQVPALEASAAGSGGVGGLGEDHLLTVQGLAACLDRLAPGGVLALTRGIQTPPRDNLKLLATVIAALRGRGVDDPLQHIVIVRDYLAVSTVVRPVPWTPERLARARAAVEARQLTPVWLEGIATDDLNQPDALPPAPDGIGDLYHWAAGRLGSPRADELIDGWAFDIRPPTDDRPFFADFCRLASIGAMREAYGELWLTRAELAFLFVLATVAIAGVAGAFATLLPLPWLGAPRGFRAVTVAYFGSIGLAYLLLEMVLLSRLTPLVGDPVRAAAVTIGAMLFFSGLGSVVSGLFRHRRARTLGVALALVAVTALVVVAVLPGLARLAGGLPVIARCAIGAALIAPTAFLMGLPMPMGLSRLGAEEAQAALIPWAWGINGFASVLAPPLAVAVAMTWGYLVVAVAAVLLYLAAALIFPVLPATGRAGARAAPGNGPGTVGTDP